MNHSDVVEMALDKMPGFKDGNRAAIRSWAGRFLAAKGIVLR